MGQQAQGLGGVNVAVEAGDDAAAPGDRLDELVGDALGRKEVAEERRSLVGSGDRSERIRTYNFPQGRVTDHRINLTLYKLAEVMAGDLDPVVQPLVNENQADQLSALSD